MERLVKPVELFVDMILIKCTGVQYTVHAFSVTLDRVLMISAVCRFMLWLIILGGAGVVMGGLVLVLMYLSGNLLVVVSSSSGKIVVISFSLVSSGKTSFNSISLISPFFIVIGSSNNV